MILVEWSAPFLMHMHSQVSADLYEGDGARPHEEDRHCNSEGELLIKMKLGVCFYNWFELGGDAEYIFYQL